jgi:hypothetical protein
MGVTNKFYEHLKETMWELYRRIKRIKMVLGLHIWSWRNESYTYT